MLNFDELNSVNKLGYGYDKYKVVAVNPTEQEVRNVGFLKKKEFKDGDIVIDFILKNDEGRQTYLGFVISNEILPDYAWRNGRVESSKPADDSEKLYKGELSLQFFVRRLFRMSNNCSSKLDMKMLFDGNYDELKKGVDICRNNYVYVLTFQRQTSKDNKTYIHEHNCTTVYGSPNVEGWKKQMESMKLDGIKWKIVPYEYGNLFNETSTQQKEEKVTEQSPENKQGDSFLETIKKINDAGIDTGEVEYGMPF